jgi:hypothetical protein
MNSIIVASLWPIIDFSSLTFTAHQLPLTIWCGFVRLCFLSSVNNLYDGAHTLREIIAHKTDGGIPDVLRIFSPFTTWTHACGCIYSPFRQPTSSLLATEPKSTLLPTMHLAPPWPQRLSMISHASCSLLRFLGGSELYRSSYHLSGIYDIFSFKNWFDVFPCF